MRVRVILNGSAASEACALEKDRVLRALSEAGIDVDRVEVTRGPGVAYAARRALEAEVDAVVVGGGDGTISTAANVLAGTGTPLGVLPLGTLNHFAKDLGLPADLDAAVRSIARGRVRAVDVAEVNGRIFVNNSSIGLYPEVVTDRDEQRERLGRNKWLAMAIAALRVMFRFPVLDVRVAFGGRQRRYRTAFVFVGNNRYATEPAHIGVRASLAEGTLCTFVARRLGRWPLLRAFVRVLIAREPGSSEDLEHHDLPEVWIDAPRRRRVRVAKDGEVVHLRPPLHYRIRPRALHVIAPEG